MDFHDRGVQVDRQRPGQILRSGADLPQPLEQLAADRVVLADVRSMTSLPLAFSPQQVGLDLVRPGLEVVYRQHAGKE